MIYNTHITAPAEQDLSDCARYIANELQNRAAAERLLDSVENEICSLEMMPYRNALVNDEDLAALGFRSFSVGNHLGFYIVREETATVVIQRILYSRRDWANILKGNK